MGKVRSFGSWGTATVRSFGTISHVLFHAKLLQTPNPKPCFEEKAGSDRAFPFFSLSMCVLRLKLQEGASAPAYPNVGALIIRIGFWGPLYYIYDKEPPKIV